MPCEDISLNNDPCQSCHLKSASKRTPWLSTGLHNLKWHIQQDGYVGTSKKIISRIYHRSVGRLVPRQSAPSAVAAVGLIHPLNLQAGDLVEIKSREEIRSTLDATGRNHGLGMMPEMWAYCGTRARVLKPVTNIVFETPNGAGVEQRRRMKHTVLLQGLMCDGRRLSCDRSCFFFWRESWLRRLNETDDKQTDGTS